MTLPPNVYAVKDRHGKTRYRFRKSGLHSRYLPHPTSIDFDSAYKQCFDPAYIPPSRGERIKPPKRSWAKYKGRKLVYFIGMRGAVKIGKTVNLYARLKKLQTGSPERLRVLACIDGGAELEAEYHTRFANHRLKGEWFKKVPCILAEIDRIREEMDDQPPMTNALSNLRRRK